MALSRIKAATAKPSGRLSKLRKSRTKPRKVFTHSVQRRIVMPRTGRRLARAESGHPESAHPETTSSVQDHDQSQSQAVQTQSPRGKHIATAQSSGLLRSVGTSRNVQVVLAGAAGVSVAAAMQRFGTGHLARRIDATDFAIMALALRKTASLISLGQLAGNAKGSSEAKAGAEKAVAAAGVAYGLAFAAAPTAARWIGAGIGAVAVSDAIDEVFAIAQQRSGPIEIIERRVTASPVKRFP